MILIPIKMKLLFLSLSMLLLTACDIGSNSITEGIHVDFSATPDTVSNLNAVAGPKTINVSGFGTVVLDKAYLVFSNLTIADECDTQFVAMAEKALNFIIPAASAHTEATENSTGEPVVINLLLADGAEIDLGNITLITDQLCGVSIDMAVADEDAVNLPAIGSGEPDMVGKSLYVSGTYNGNPFIISKSVTLIGRDLLFLTPLDLSATNLSEEVLIAVNYDSWFDSLDPAGLGDASPVQADVDQFFINIASSIHQKSN
ncbi:MAG: hypothetical protein DIZ80_00225 [endosymbiont of Galathealinum brachiosum]|uniref:DUF4382 domain-containing protein n=1 Tax=endosymbiont of Galathealinum brachiosum TaxID=2200906 RepID=A0A370DNR1_9GAMM|nr:MAG: hypothetical protein DIZ80_00225 [endosymbiont of Galathealinum brachiosum]